MVDHPTNIVLSYLNIFDPTFEHVTCVCKGNTYIYIHIIWGYNQVVMGYNELTTSQRQINIVKYMWDWWRCGGSFSFSQQDIVVWDQASAEILMVRNNVRKGVMCRIKLVQHITLNWNTMGYTSDNAGLTQLWEMRIAARSCHKKISLNVNWSLVISSKLEGHQEQMSTNMERTKPRSHHFCVAKQASPERLPNMIWKRPHHCCTGPSQKACPKSE